MKGKNLKKNTGQEFHKIQYLISDWNSLES